jgi:hypothetical protein
MRTAVYLTAAVALDAASLAAGQPLLAGAGVVMGLAGLASAVVSAALGRRRLA